MDVFYEANSENEPEQGHALENLNTNTQNLASNCGIPLLQSNSNHNSDFVFITVPLAHSEQHTGHQGAHSKMLGKVEVLDNVNGTHANTARSVGDRATSNVFYGNWNAKGLSTEPNPNEDNKEVSIADAMMTSSNRRPSEIVDLTLEEKVSTRFMNVEQSDGNQDQKILQSPPIHNTRSIGKSKSKQKLKKRSTKGTHHQFKCSYCDYSVKFKCHLKTHVLKHTNERPFACDHCDKRFNQKCNLNTHIKTQHGHRSRFAEE